MLYLGFFQTTIGKQSETNPHNSIPINYFPSFRMTKLISPLCSTNLLLCSNYEKTIAICFLKGLFVMKNDEKFINFFQFEYKYIFWIFIVFFLSGCVDKLPSMGAVEMIVLVLNEDHTPFLYFQQKT